MLRLLLCYYILLKLTLNYVTSSVMTIIPAMVIQNAENSLIQTLRCSLTKEEQSTSINSLLYMKINHYDAQGNNSVQIYASMTSTKDASLGTAPELIRLEATVSGRMENQTDAELVLAWNSSLVLCQDRGVYQCEVGFLDSQVITAFWKANKTLAVLSINLIVNVSQDDIPISPSQATSVNPMEITEGLLAIKCTGNVGSQNGTRVVIQTATLAETPEFQDFSPEPGDDYVEQPAEQTDCGFERVTILDYNVTQEHVQRGHVFGFRCAFNYTEYGTEVERFSEGFFFRAVPVTTPVTTTMSTTLTSTTGTSTNGTTTPSSETHSSTASLLSSWGMIAMTFALWRMCG